MEERFIFVSSLMGTFYQYFGKIGSLCKAYQVFAEKPCRRRRFPRPKADFLLISTLGAAQTAG
jgi:hypothetical protein